MVHTSLKHIQGKKGSRWAKFIRKTGTENILMVAVDAAKYSHKAMICNFYGDILIEPFEFDASLSGFREFVTKIQKEKKRQKMKEVVVGIETTGHYYEDLVKRSNKEGFHVRIINAVTTAEERKILLNWSKTDNLDLLAILQAMINGRGTSSSLPTGSVHNLQKLTRARRDLVQKRTSIQNLIRVYADRIFREFQGKDVYVDGKRKRLKPLSNLFGKASCYIMRNCLHPSDLLSLGEEGLRKLSIEHNLKLRDDSIRLLLDLARDSISEPKECVETEQFLLNQQLDLLSLYNEQIQTLEEKIEDLFIQTEGAILLSVQGIGLVSGAELYAEMGNISDFENAGQLIKMAGTNPIVKQSGDRKPTYYAISRQGRRPFRNIVYQVGRSLSVNNPDMSQHYQALIERGKHPRQAYIAIGNRMIRLAYSMIKHQTLYQTECKNYVLVNEIRKKLHKKYAELFFAKFVVPIPVKSAS